MVPPHRCHTTLSRPALALLLVGCLLMVSCGDARRSAPHEAGPAFEGARAESVLAGSSEARAPSFEQVPCAEFDLADRSLAARCGYVAVPEDRAQSDGRTIKLAVVVFESTSAEPDPAPLVWLEGGPGSASIDQFALILTNPAGRIAFRDKDMRADRDLVVFDQRGTGRSRPSLACPELRAVSNPVSDARAGRPESVRTVAQEAERCRNRLRAEGVDLAAYTSSENAADVNDIRRALGYERINLYGNSYGTRLALTVMRDFPDTVRGAVLDAVLPLQVDLYAGVFESAQRSLDRFFQGCAEDIRCSTAYPGLDAVFYDLVARLNAAPLTLSATRGAGPTRLTGDGLIAAMFQLLYATPLYPLLPGMISSLRDGNAATFALTAQQIQTTDLVSFGMYYSIQCGEESVFHDPAAGEQRSQAARPDVVKALAPVLSAPLFAICPSWGARPALPRENEPVQSTIPTLLLAGEWDPITPPAFAELAAQALTNSHVVTFPATGHVALIAPETCPYEIAWAFLRDPSARPDDACVGGMNGPAWIVRR
jgi:pimeloyl-ACP methyl ester carboxylesterase